MLCVFIFNIVGKNKEENSSGKNNINKFYKPSIIAYNNELYLLLTIHALV